MSRESVCRSYGERVATEVDFIIQTLDELLLIVDRGKDALVDDVLLQRAVEGCANRIGDKIRNRVPEALQAEYGGPVYWSEWVDWRVMLMHQYHRLDIDLLWTDLVRDVPQFREYLAGTVLC